MKPTEIMVGDIFLVGGKPVKVSAVSINGSVETLSTEGRYYAQAERLTPIPLTEEMMAKNGWSGPSAGEYYLGKDIVFLEWRTDNKAFFLNDALLPYALEWVHQLQHTLRIVGLADLADNFKIK